MRALIGTALIALTLCAGAAQSPSSTKKPQACGECTITFPAAVPDKRGTKDAPLKVDIDTSPEAQAHETWERAKGERDSDTNKRIADFTAMLFLATIVLGLVGVGQGVLIWRQINLGRDEFIATNRPRMALREAYVDPPKEDVPVAVTYVLANLGGTEATILRCEFHVERLNLQDPKKQVSVNMINNVGDLPTKFNAGAYAQRTFIGSANWPSPLSAWPKYATSLDNPDPPPVVLTGNDMRAHYFFGRIVYKDDREVERTMAFYRILQAGSYRFVPVRDPQLEYSDTSS